MGTNKLTKSHNKSNNYLVMVGGLTKRLKLALINILIFIIIIVLIKPTFSLLLLFIVLIALTNSVYLKMNFKNTIKTITYALLYATIIHYMFILLGSFGFLGLLLGAFLLVGYRLKRIRKGFNSARQQFNKMKEARQRDE